ncbi:hypothetical protein SAMN05216593_112108 [Pseudomonas asturiensis]|uniref:J domain-containing protein n=2 Tax=Pseudomonas asturiensis TaxID=1190415 RepID=A0A1M7PPU3_9PSED|nr:hypothetical protein SAMN05216593_112108 [Pseudomonas asturiensis]
MTTMDCWAVLELDRNADERSIKRQYAKLLKTNRPDDDPAAFQTLRDAYEQALGWARNGAKEDSDDNDGAVDTLDARALTPLPFAPAPVVQPPETRPLPSVEKQQETEHEQPSLRPAVETSWYEQASLTTPQNLASQRQTARDQGCDEKFQQHLARRCLLDLDDHLELIQAAVAQLQWLTPWQKVQFSSHQTRRLTLALLDSSRPALRALLEDHKEREFLEALKALKQQPWLSSLDQHDQLEHWIMTLLLSSDEWSAPLFERICDLFDWDQKHDVHAGTPSLWMHLIERCEKKEFVIRQQQLLEGPMDSSPAYAAHLLLDPPTLKTQLRIARECHDSVWEACERLYMDLTHRFPDLLEHFPYADLQGWQKRRAQVTFRPKVRVYLVGIVLTIMMLLSRSTTGKIGWSDVIIYTMTLPLLVLWGFYIAKSIWNAGCDQIKPLDVWLSERLLPEALSWPGYQALLIRHGAPVLFIGSVYAQENPLLLLPYSVAMLLWIYLSPYRMSLISEAIARKTGGWTGFKHYWARNTGRWVMITLGIMLIFVIAVIISSPDPRH